MKYLTILLIFINIIGGGLFYSKIYQLTKITDLVTLEIVKFNRDTKKIKGQIDNAEKKINGFDKKLDDIKKKLGKGLF